MTQDRTGAGIWIMCIAMLIFAIICIELTYVYRGWRDSDLGFIKYIKAQFIYWLRRWAGIKLAFLPSVVLSFYFLMFGADRFTAAARAVRETGAAIAAIPGGWEQLAAAPLVSWLLAGLGISLLWPREM